MSSSSATQKIPRWYWVVSILLLIWNVMGIMNFFEHLFISEEALQKLPSTHQDIIRNMPGWIFVVFGVAVFSGVAGSVALLMKRKVAKLFFGISLISSSIQLGRSVMADEFKYYGTPEIIISTLILVLIIVGIWLSKYATRQNWMR